MCDIELLFVGWGLVGCWLLCALCFCLVDWFFGFGVVLDFIICCLWIWDLLWWVGFVGFVLLVSGCGSLVFRCVDVGVSFACVGGICSITFCLTSLLSVGCIVCWVCYVGVDLVV